MLPHTVILSIFSVFLAQGNVVHALPQSGLLYTRSERLAGRDRALNIGDRTSAPFAKDVAEFPYSDTLGLERRIESGTLITGAVSAYALPGLCDYGHKLYAGIFVYVNCPKPVRNLKKAFSDLKQAGKQAIDFSPDWDVEARAAHVMASVPANMKKGKEKVSLRKALLDTADQLQKASFIILDRPGAQHYRAGGTNADVGGTPLYPEVPDIIITPPKVSAVSVKRPAPSLLAPPAMPTEGKSRLPPA